MKSAFELSGRLRTTSAGSSGVFNHQCLTTLPWSEPVEKELGSSQPSGWQGGPSLLPVIVENVPEDRSQLVDLTWYRCHANIGGDGVSIVHL